MIVFIWYEKQIEGKSLYSGNRTSCLYLSEPLAYQFAEILIQERLNMTCIIKTIFHELPTKFWYLLNDNITRVKL